jgi:hypothetical protein
MSKIDHGPVGRRGRAMTALLATTVAALTGGVQALSPAAAVAATNDGTVACTESTWFNECEDPSGAGGVGAGGGAPSGDGGSDYWPWEDDSGSTSGGGDGGTTSIDPGYGGNGYDVPAVDPNNPPSSTQVEWREPYWVPWSDPARDRGWSQRHLRYLYGQCESIQDDVEDIRDDLRHGKSGGRWWTLQSREKRVKALHKSWTKLGCADLFDMVEG